MADVLVEDIRNMAEREKLKMRRKLLSPAGEWLA
jgi:hypothetical protein